MSDVAPANHYFRLLPDEARYPHEPDIGEMWNDSGLIGWVDHEAELCGFFRFGYQPNRGVANYQCGVSSFDGLRYRNTQKTLKLVGNEARERGFRLNDFFDVEFGPRSNRWRGRDADIDYDIEMHEFNPLFDFGLATGLSDDAATKNESASHYEVSGRVTGSVRLDGKVKEINCLGYGDRSWGPRNWGMRAHRWCVGLFGEDLSFVLVSAVIAPSYHLQAGYVLQNGVVHRARDIDIVVNCEEDGVTHRGGRIVFSAKPKERYDIRFDVHDCVLLEADLHLGADGLSTIHWGDRAGVGILECSNNARGGEGIPPIIIGAAAENGISRRRNPRA